MLPNPVFAQFAGGGDIASIIFPFIIVGAIMYFLIIRPQRQQAQARQKMLEAVRRNDTIISSGGIVGKVTKVIDDQEVEVEIAKDVRVRMVRALIADVRSKGEAVKGE